VICGPDGSSPRDFACSHGSVTLTCAKACKVWHCWCREGLGRDPFAGDVFVFRGRAGTLIKALSHDGVGLSLYAKRLDPGRFI